MKILYIQTCADEEKEKVLMILSLPSQPTTQKWVKSAFFFFFRYVDKIWTSLVHQNIGSLKKQKTRRFDLLSYEDAMGIINIIIIISPSLSLCREQLPLHIRRPE